METELSFYALKHKELGKKGDKEHARKINAEVNELFDQLQREDWDDIDSDDDDFYGYLACTKAGSP